MSNRHKELLIPQDQSEQSIQLRDQIQKRIYHPTVSTFFDRYLDLGLFIKTSRFLSSLSADSQSALQTTLATHVHKEKPVFVSIYGKSLGLDAEQIASVAMAVDLLWAISLMYDDMFDGDRLRSGITTVWATYGKDKTVAICYEIFEAILSDLNTYVGSEIATLAKNYVQRGLDSLGKHTQLPLSTSVEELYQNYHQRNDFNGTFGMHAITQLARQSLLEADDRAIIFIRNLNLASQLLNDLKDIDDFYDRGYSDIRNGVVTVPISHLYASLSAEEQEAFLRIYGSKQDLTPTDQDFIVNMVNKYDVVSDTVRRINAHYASAEQMARDFFSTNDFVLIQSWIEYKKEPLQRYV